MRGLTDTFAETLKRGIVADALASWATTFEDDDEEDGEDTMSKLEWIAGRIRLGIETREQAELAVFHLGQKFQTKYDYVSKGEQVAVEWYYGQNHTNDLKQG